VRVETAVRMGFAAAVCCLGAAGALAQGSAASPAAAPPVQKFAVINIRQAIVTTAEGKQASAELQSQFAARANELESMSKQIADIQWRLNDGANTLSDEAKAQLTSQGQKLATLLERKKTEYQEDLNNAQGEAIDKIGRKMLDVINRYARENGITLVLNSATDNSPLLYNSQQVEITADIIRLFDTAYPVKAGNTAAPAQKPAPKPTAQQQTPAQQKPKP
jgi:outer membrane protein